MSVPFIQQGPSGKAFPEGLHTQHLTLSLSQSGGMAVFAVSQDYEIGADIECMNDFPEMDKIAKDMFSVLENEVFRSSSRGLKRERFFAGWTCREALAKALGDGLSQPLDRFDVSVNAGESAILRGIDANPKEASQWALRQLRPAQNYLGAVAIKEPYV